MRRLLPIVRTQRTTIVIAGFFGLLSLGAQVAVPALARDAIDTAQFGPRSDLTTICMILGVVAVVRLFTSGLYRYLLFKMAYRIDASLRLNVYEHLTTLSFSYFDRTQSGQIISRANTDIRSIQLLFAFGPLVGTSVVMFFVAFIYMLSIHVGLTLVAVATLPGVFVFGKVFRDEVFPLSWVTQARQAEVATIVDENINGTRVVKSFAAEPAEVNKLAAAAGRLQWSALETIRSRARYNPLIEALPRLGLALVLLYGGWLAIDDRVTIGTLFAFNAYVIMMQVPFRMAGFLLLQAQRARSAADRIFQVLDEAPEISDSPSAVDLLEPAGKVEFRDVSFRYPSAPDSGVSERDGATETPHILTDLSFSLAPGETVAIVGQTGSGKSTIARLLARFYEIDSGAILVDGSPLEEITLRSLRHHIGLVLDDPFLFSASIHDNIAYGRPDAGRNEVVAAARAAAAHEFVQDMEHGYDTVVGERGYTLSGGQRQRLAIARALLCKPRILVLDDATSAIDVQVENEIHTALDVLLSETTSLVIAHRLSTISLADRVLLLADGHIVASGTHDQLLATEPRYVEILANAEAVPEAAP